MKNGRFDVASSSVLFDSFIAFEVMISDCRLHTKFEPRLFTGSKNSTGILVFYTNTSNSIYRDRTKSKSNLYQPTFDFYFAINEVPSEF